MPTLKTPFFTLAVIVEGLAEGQSFVSGEPTVASS